MRLFDFAGRKRLKVGNIPSPPILVSADDVTHGKPDPEPYLLGAHLLGLDPSSIVVFEDAPNGIRSAKAAGMTVVALATSHPCQDLRLADVCINDLNGVRVSESRNVTRLELTPTR